MTHFFLLRFFVLMVFMLWIPLTVAAQGGDSTAKPELVDRFEPKPGVVRYDGSLRILGLDDNPTLKQHLTDLAFESRRIIREKTTLDWDETAYIVWTSEDDFQRFTNFASESTAAAASAQRMTIWINERAWKSATPQERAQTLTHEMGHLLLGRITGGERVPLWAEEGIVQHLAEEWSWLRGQEYAIGNAADSIPSLLDIQYAFPTDPKLRQNAYLVSYKAVGALIDELGENQPAGSNQKADVGVLLLLLNNPSTRAEWLTRLWDPLETKALEHVLENGKGNRWVSVIISVFSDTTFWLIILVLVILAWIKKKVENARRVRSEQEEAWRESLTQDDVIDVYGPREDDPEAIPEQLTPWDRHLRDKEAEEEEMERRKRGE
ncbi:MAG: hypothetical protein SFY68_03580 [Candidatus Sumerlaeia bacterium]|nr:hypothetical protein [Candidatus Sumerlaeia bacterium]